MQKRTKRIFTASTFAALHELYKDVDHEKRTDIDHGERKLEMPEEIPPKTFINRDAGSNDVN